MEKKTIDEVQEYLANAAAAGTFYVVGSTVGALGWGFNKTIIGKVAAVLAGVGLGAAAGEAAYGGMAYCVNFGKTLVNVIKEKIEIRKEEDSDEE